MKTLNPESIIELIEFLLGKDQPNTCLNKACFDIVLLMAIKLFSHPHWPTQYLETDFLKQKALQTVSLAIQSKNGVPAKLIQFLLSISIFDANKSAQICGEMVKKFLFASAVFRHTHTPNLKSLELKGGLESKQSAFKLAHFMDQTQDFYTVNPQNMVHDEAIRESVVKFCQVVKQGNNTDIQLKQAVLDNVLALERKQVPEFEKLITSTKQNEKQVSALIKQATETVSTSDSG